ncbi:MAG TPA: hypothetical protein VJ896_01060 [Bacteroidales bacterium]|nr:hypothetical protein [Bacteroidales bacterium]
MRKLFTILVPMTIGILLTVSVFLPQKASAQTPEKGVLSDFYFLLLIH